LPAFGTREADQRLPEGMPMIGEPPANEAPGRFPTGYFGRRQDALDWLAG
jgi:hypothetical protein